jgi:ABC-2 family transporter protein
MNNVNNNSAMQRLMWKDFKIVQPLFWCAIGSSVVMNLMLGFAFPEYVHDWSTGLWIIVPHCLTFGVAAMLVGTEQDARTIDWTRSLPISWQSFASSKLIVALLNVLITWVVASLVYWLVNATIDDPRKLSMEREDLWRAVAVNAFSGSFLLLLGFALAYALRSAVTGLLLLLPLFFMLVVGGIELLEYFELFEISQLIAAAAGLWLAMFAGQFWLARRRLTAPTDNRAANALAKFTSSVDLVPRNTMRLRSRPHEIVSLLWQQVRQTGPWCASMLAIAVVMFTLYCLGPGAQQASGFPNPLPIMMLLLLFSSWFGVTTFYGDTQRRRCAFFADRGVSPTRVWWTRLAPTALAYGVFVVAIIVITTLLPRAGWKNTWGQQGLEFFLIASCILYAFGQFIAQGTPRPILAFVAGPALAGITFIPWAWATEHFYRSVEPTPVLLLVVPVLLFGTWRLTSDWLEDRRRYTVRAACYILMAIILPSVWVCVQAISSGYLYAQIVTP